MNKKKIISEIMRTASQNNDVPLGVDRFREETGIRKEDWYGIFLAKWSDAQLEAGFKPNQFGEPAFNKEWLLEKIAQYIRELGHFPTKGELKLKKQDDAEFPNITTLRNRLGTKAEMVNEVLEHFRSNESWRDVINICLAIQASLATNTRSDGKTDEGVVGTGQVYLLEHDKTYKIGRSTDPSRRYKEIRTQMPYETKEIHVIETDDPVGIEAYWHNRFKDKRLEGEWFKLTASEIKAFKKRKYM